ncbi:MAG: ketopantoate reductase family protein [Vulcanimicrobiota bacterium]
MFGAGAIGQWLGADLFFGGQEVSLFVRPRQREALEADGIVLSDGRVARPGCFSDPTELAGLHFDLIILTVKTFQVAEAVRQLVESGVSFDYAVTMQNGLDTEQLVVEAMGPDKVIVGTTTRPVAWEDDGRLNPSQRGGVGLSMFTGADLPEQACAPFEAAHIPVLKCRDYRSLKWSKLILNMVCNASCAILDRTPDQVIVVAEVFRLEHKAVSEALAVVQRLGVKLRNLPDYPVSRFARAAHRLPWWLLKPILVPKIVSGRAGKPPSFLLDLRSGRGDSEVRWLNGAIVEHARELGLRAPVNQALGDILTEIVSGCLDWDQFRDRPSSLVTEVRRRLSLPS